MFAKLFRDKKKLLDFRNLKKDQNAFKILSATFFQVILSNIFFGVVCCVLLAKTCDPGWKDWTGTEWCYLLVHDKKSYADAQAHCESLNAGLAQVLTQAENDFLLRK